MEPLLVIGLVYESTNRGRGLFEVPVAPTIHFLRFQRLHEALGPSIIVGITRPTHTHRDAASLQPLDVRTASILNTAIGMMHQPRPGLSPLQCRFQCFLGKAA